MDDILNSLSKKGKKFKHRLRGKKHKPGGTETNALGESAGSSGSLLRPESHVVAGGRDGEQNRTTADVQGDLSEAWPPQPEPISAGGSDDDRQRREADVDKKEEEASQRH